MIVGTHSVPERSAPREAEELPDRHAALDQDSSWGQSVDGGIATRTSRTT
jgi:hypothetical protein